MNEPNVDGIQDKVAQPAWGVRDEWGYDFYRFGDSGLPPMEILECDKKMAQRWYGEHGVTGQDLGLHEWRISRERQLLASIAENRLLQRTNDVLTRTVAATIERASKSEAENRQKDAELALLRQNHPFGAMYDQIQKLQAELAELRSLGGDREFMQHQKIECHCGLTCCAHGVCPKMQCMKCDRERMEQRQKELATAIAFAEAGAETAEQAWYRAQTEFCLEVADKIGGKFGEGLASEIRHSKPMPYKKPVIEVREKEGL